MTSSAHDKSRPQSAPQASYAQGGSRRRRGGDKTRPWNRPRRLRTIVRHLRHSRTNATGVADASRRTEEKPTTNRTLPLVRRQRQGHRRPRRRRSPIGTAPRGNLRRRAGRPLRRTPPPVRRDAQLRQRAEPVQVHDDLPHRRQRLPLGRRHVVEGHHEVPQM